jgi:hypothetical protein
VNDVDERIAVVDSVDDSKVTYSESPEIARSLEFLDAVRPRYRREAVDRASGALSDTGGKAAQLALGGAGNDDPVVRHAASGGRSSGA